MTIVSVKEDHRISRVKGGVRASRVKGGRVAAPSRACESC
jgi:hypothetical protein